MKGLPILVVLVSVAQFCCAMSPPVPNFPLCGEDSRSLNTHLSVRHINEHHHHGYKFKLSEVQGYKVEKVDDDNCNIELQLDLLETTCHEVNPKNVEDCEIRSEEDRGVMAKCLVTVTVTSGAPQVTKYECETKLVKTNQEMTSMCPDCPILLALNSSTGLKSIEEAVKKVNQDHTHQHYYVLHDVGRIKSGYMFQAGMGYWAEFALVETRCPKESRIVPEACQPLCPDRAGHAFCKSSYTTGNGLGSVDCEFYPASNTTALGDGEQEPDCTPPHAPVGPCPPGPHFHGRVGSPSPPDHGHVGPPSPPDHDHVGHPSPPDHGHVGPPSPPNHHMFSINPCHASLSNPDPAIHHICPWPHP